LRDHAARLETRLKAVRTQGVAVAKRGTDAVVTVAGGAVAGLLGAYLPNIPGTQIETDLAVGAGLTAIGVLGLLGSYDEQVTDFGAGILAVATARGLRTALGK
jgi:ABC-type uncharacterized transport system permease subunit